jgi:hypothetical protein
MRKRPIGQILVERGEISEADLQAALTEQERTGRRLGEILIEQGQTSWLALARALAEQVLDIQAPPDEPPRDPVEAVRAMVEKVASLPPVPDPLPPPEPVRAAHPAPAVHPAPEVHPAPAADPERELARAVAEQVAGIDSPAAKETHLLHLTPRQHFEDPEAKLHSIEALLRERQRAFIELFTTAETLRMKVARLEDLLDERDRELSRLRIRAVS